MPISLPDTSTYVMRFSNQTVRRLRDCLGLLLFNSSRQLVYVSQEAEFLLKRAREELPNGMGSSRLCTEVHDLCEQLSAVAEQCRVPREMAQIHLRVFRVSADLRVVLHGVVLPLGLGLRDAYFLVIMQTGQGAPLSSQTPHDHQPCPANREHATARRPRQDHTERQMAARLGLPNPSVKRDSRRPRS